MNMNNTNPDNPKPIYKPRKIDWDWRDQVVLQLTKFGVPVTIATVAVIDLRETLDKCSVAKLDATQTANILITVVQQYYNNGAKY
jgi:hypothetical protein